MIVHKFAVRGVVFIIYGLKKGLDIAVNRFSHFSLRVRVLPDQL